MMHGGGRPGGPGGRLFQEEEKPKDTSKVLKRLLQTLIPYKKEVSIAFIMIILSAATQGLGPYLTGVAIDKYISVGDQSGLGYIFFALVATFLVGSVATRAQIYIMSKVGQQILADLRKNVFEKIESLSLQFLESKQAGELMSRQVNDIDVINNFISQSFIQMIGSIFALLGIGVAMLLVSWKLGLAVILMVPVLLYTTRFFSQLARGAFRKTRETIGDVSANMEEEISGIKVAQAFNRSDVNIKKFAERNAANRDANVSATAITSAFNPAMDVLITLDLALVAGLGGVLVINNSISIGVVVAFLQYVQNFFRPIQQVAQLWTTAQSAFAAAERVFSLMDITATVEDKSLAIDLLKINGKVEFKDVCFAYEEDQHVLKDINLTVNPGETLAVVGSTGAGKTTLVSLLARFYDPSEGAILVDGNNLKDVKQKSLRSKMGIVTQEPFLFSGSITDNIRYGRLNASDEEIKQAAIAANADQFIEKLPDGYKTEVGERGKLLSQGQRQLISIARAVLANPRILILDEATASIDTRTESLIQKALNALLIGRTSFVIAHRLSTVRNANQVIVIEDGRIVERGTHDGLIKTGGIYADLYKRQFYIPGEVVSLN
jgi:ATP-binding cassette subfamily B protein/subfamily B ATP-binding cassette protein MsbA